MNNYPKRNTDEKRNNERRYGEIVTSLLKEQPSLRFDRERMHDLTHDAYYASKHSY
jgi:hypothetical protein